MERVVVAFHPCSVAVPMAKASGIKSITAIHMTEMRPVLECSATLFQVADEVTNLPDKKRMV